MTSDKTAKIINRFAEMQPRLDRTRNVFTVTVEATMEEFFPLLCPVLEADWIPGWTAELIYSQSGYAEKGVVWKTDETNLMGPGVWIFTDYVKDRLVKLVSLRENVVAHLTVKVTDNGDGAVSSEWDYTVTAINEAGNREVAQQPSANQQRERFTGLFRTWLDSERDTSKSAAIVRRYRERETPLMRKYFEFSGTFETDMDSVFKLFCPVMEAEWIPGWDAKLLYTESGLAEDKVTWTTDETNPIGTGLWTFADYKKNELVEFVALMGDMLVDCTIHVVDNGDGTVTITWKPVLTALSEAGNEQVLTHGPAPGEDNPVPPLIQSYLDQLEM